MVTPQSPSDDGALFLSTISPWPKSPSVEKVIELSEMSIFIVSENSFICLQMLVISLELRVISASKPSVFSGILKASCSIFINFREKLDTLSSTTH